MRGLVGWVLVRARMVAAASLALLGACSRSVEDVDWPVYGGNAAGQRFSQLEQINRGNVAGLKIAWRHDTGEGGLQTSPIVVDRTLYAYTPKSDVIALDAATGERRWTFTPPSPGLQPARGLAYWAGAGDRRILAGVMNELWALNADTGEPVASFGTGGKVDLRAGLGGDEDTHAVFLTSPGVIYQDLIIVGFRTSETPPAAPGAIRAYDVRTGALRWIHHVIPGPGESSGNSWPDGARFSAGAANNWTGMVLDEARGIVFAPTGSAAPDFFGGRRPGDNVGANSLLAIEASSGRLLWSFQTVRHDIWDRDLPSPPVLLKVERNGEAVDAVAQATKQGYLFVLDRETGKSLFPIEDRPFPVSEVPGEIAAATQPVPLIPEPFSRQLLTRELLTERTPEAAAWAVKEFERLRNLGPFTPLSLEGQTVVFPGFDGGAEWGGQAVDPGKGVFYINSNDIVWTGGLRPAAAGSDPASGASIYALHCVVCHGSDLRGSGDVAPALSDIGARRTAPELTRIIRNGAGRMPGFPGLSEANVEGLVAYLRRPDPDSSQKTEVGAPGREQQADYVFTGYRKFLDPDGYPAVKPPWGVMSAIDLNSGAYLWRRPLGEYPELAAQGLGDTGTENYGGPLVTASGLVFIGATIFDRKFRALDSATGNTLFETELPFAGVATPITYTVDGQQFVVIAASGARDRRGPQGSAYVAYALPGKDSR
jgi:quinoprotein glucose dehydrogenase